MEADLRAEAVVETAVRLHVRYGAKEAVRLAEQFATWGGPRSRRFWREVRESITDAVGVQ